MYVTEHYRPDLRILSCDMVRGNPHVVWDCDNLSAPEWRYYWMPHPHARIFLDRREYRPGPDEIVLIPPNTPFMSRCAEPLFQFVIHFLAAPPFDAVAPDLLVLPARAEWRENIDRIVGRLDAGNGFDRSLAMLTVALCLDALNAIPPDRLRFRTGDPVIQAAMDDIERRYGGELAVPDLARAAGMSVNAFIRRFRAYTGATPQQYVIRQRIEHACVMLEHSVLTIDEIAEAAGFRHRNHFTRTFIRIRGTGPAAYRRRARERMRPDPAKP